MATNNLPALVDRAEWSLMTEQAATLVPTGFLPESIKTAGQAAAIMLKGRELSLPAMYALSNIVVIKGKPTASAELLAALIYRDHGDAALIPVETTATRATYRYKRRAWGEYRTFSFSIEEARQAGLLNNPTWGKYPAAMLRARAVSAIARMAFPDSIGGLYTPEELGAAVEVDGEGQITITAAPEPVRQTATPDSGGTVAVDVEEPAEAEYRDVTGPDPDATIPPERFKALKTLAADAGLSGDALRRIWQDLEIKSLKWSALTNAEADRLAAAFVAATAPPASAPEPEPAAVDAFADIDF